jgi:hypothetical protein
MLVHLFGAFTPSLPPFMLSSLTSQALDPEDCLALPGPSLLSQTISIKSLLHERQLQETVYDPLSYAERLAEEDIALGLSVCDASHWKGVTHAVTHKATSTTCSSHN